MSQLNRRSFFKTAMTAVGLVAVSGSFTSLFAQGRRKKEAAAPSGELPLVEPGKGMAASVNYQHSHAGIKNDALKVEKQGVKWAEQDCANCVLYTKVGMRGSDEVGKCTLFPNQVVMAKGWCTSWSKKP